MKYLVWKRGLRGPEATFDADDPRTMPDFKAREHQIIQVVTLNDAERFLMTLDELKKLHPCPPYEV